LVLLYVLSFSESESYQTDHALMLGINNMSAFNFINFFYILINLKSQSSVWKPRDAISEITKKDDVSEPINNVGLRKFIISPV